MTANFNCQPYTHALPDGTPVTLGSGLDSDADTCDCGHVSPRTHDEPGILRDHITMPSGVYRRVEMTPPVRCPACGNLMSIAYVPCGNPTPSLFANVHVEQPSEIA